MPRYTLADNGMESKKTLDENRFRKAQKTMDHPAPNFQLGDRVHFKNKQPGKWNLKWRARYRIVCIEHNGHYLHVGNWATGKNWSCNVQRSCASATVELCNVDTKFGLAEKFLNHPTNLPTITCMYLAKQHKKIHCSLTYNTTSS